MLTARCFSACGLDVVRGERTRPVWPEQELHSSPGVRREAGWIILGYPAPLRARVGARYQLHPLVAPQVLHFIQVPLRTNV